MYSYNYLPLLGTDIYEPNLMNVWQGRFPKHNTLQDGYAGSNIYRPMNNIVFATHPPTHPPGRVLYISFHLIIPGPPPVGLAPAVSYPPNALGFYNLLGNTWEWVAGGKPDKVIIHSPSLIVVIHLNIRQRILRGGSFLDSIDGSFNHIVVVSPQR